jgi:hypothetical protein
MGWGVEKRMRGLGEEGCVGRALRLSVWMVKDEIVGVSLAGKASPQTTAIFFHASRLRPIATLLAQTSHSQLPPPPPTPPPSPLYRSTHGRVPPLAAGACPPSPTQGTRAPSRTWRGPPSRRAC